jgi:DNA-binding NarL/FixJ family response regulator
VVSLRECAILLSDQDGGSDDAPAADRSAPAAELRTEPKPGAGARILLVEDEFLVGMEVEAGLKDAGFDVVGVAASAADALALATEERPLLVVMDVRLAGKDDGVDAALAIYHQLGIRSLFASAHVDAQVRARAAGAMPLGWLSKPYRVSLLVAAVERALAELGR